MKNKCKLLLLLTTLFYIVGCTTDSKNWAEVQESSLLTFQLSGPESLNPTSLEMLDASKIKIYIFNELNGDAHQLKFISNLDNIKVEHTGNNKYRVDVQIPKTFKGQYHAIVLTSNKIEELEAANLNETYQQVKHKLTKRLSNKVDKSDLLDMSAHFRFNVDTPATYINVSLVRAWARVDFTLAEDQSKSKYAFKNIKSIRIYRSSNMYSAIYGVENIGSNNKITQPTLPDNKQYLLYKDGEYISSNNLKETDLYPIIYHKETTDVSANFEDKIILPEAYNAPNMPRAEATAAVIGVNIENESGAEELRYYRVDFAEYNQLGKPEQFQSILRNKIYIFELSGANTKGGETPEEVLTEESSLYVNFQEWDNKDIAGNSINGEYSLLLSSDPLVIKYEKGSTLNIEYGTNLSPGQMEKNLEIIWLDKDLNEFEKSDSERPFDHIHKAAEKTITVTARHTNDSGNDIPYFIDLKLYKQTFRINVTQLSKSPSFEFTKLESGENYIVNGIYQVQKYHEADPKNTITVRVRANTKDELEGLAYHIYSDEIEGIKIDSKGYFNEVETKGSYSYATVSLKVKGLTDNPHDKTFILYTNSKKTTFLRVVIPFAMTPKKILGYFSVRNKTPLSANKNFQTLIANNSNYENYNFGMNDKSYVRIQGLSYEEITVQGNGVIDFSRLETLKPDVIILADGSINNYEVLKPLINYISTYKTKYGGSPALIIMTQGDTMHTIAKSLNLYRNDNEVDGKTGIVKVNSSIQGTIETIYRLNNDNIKLIESEGTYRMFLPKYDWDLITNGPFGDIGALYPQIMPGTDALAYLRLDKTIKYTGNRAYAQTSNIELDWAYSIFRCTEYPILYIGHTDFLNNEFNWLFSDIRKQLILTDRTNLYTATNEKNNRLILLKNGVFFANVLNWAFRTSEYGYK